ncbi:LOW QUALITY PROTEIN: fatty-acid amide hydrolase 2-like [Ceratina calcarata]|uniref:LOW QUALITY PROTEIN: fatty-acid amide hydrolase 2-like n=1 Tax=Ceratina calcarata TaxID=156304 RepID=A0AAJ7WB76_9HYME|nr:LOW QUALITY PROTEIN: fatty-acid amide hydrolase 2-like [Ceratina calcarata]
MCTLTRSTETQGNGTQPHEMRSENDVLRILVQILRFSIIQFHAAFDCLVHLVFGLYYDFNVKKVPPVKNDIVLMSASELAEKISNRRDHRSEEDATVVRLVKDAGGILIAKTNIPEFNLWTESRNHLYGQTCNPYNTTRNVGGSSGGEGAIIAACGSAFSVASDIGGSTNRMPAFFNGVFGLKPSEGLTPLKGIALRQQDYSNSMAEIGPICKKAEDLIPLCKVFIGERKSLLKLDQVVDLKSLNIFYQESSGDLRASGVNGDMKAALLKAVRHFKEVTGSATKIKIPGSKYSYRLWRFWMTQESVDYKTSITNGKYRASAVCELWKLMRGKSDFTLAAIIKLIDEDILPKENAEWAKSVTANMKKYLMTKRFQTLFQVVAAPYNDHLCLAVARELEKAHGGWVPPA